MARRRRSVNQVVSIKISIKLGQEIIALITLKIVDDSKVIVFSQHVFNVLNQHNMLTKLLWRRLNEIDTK